MTELNLPCNKGKKIKVKVPAQQHAPAGKRKMTFAEFQKAAAKNKNVDPTEFYTDEEIKNLTEAMDPRIKARIESELGIKVYLIRDNFGYEVYMKSPNCPKGQKYDIVYFDKNGTVELGKTAKGMNVNKIESACKRSLGVSSSLNENYFPY